MRPFLLSIWFVQYVRCARFKHTVSEPDTTVKGCVCKSGCKAKLLNGLHRCDECKTKGKCGTWALTGRWDYCNYAPVDSYKRLSYKAKMDKMWAKVIADKSFEEPKATDTIGGFTESMMTVFDNYKPEMPKGRKKVIHMVGSMCKIDLKINKNSPYTGLLGHGTHRGLIRIGTAVVSEEGLTPGLGFKFPRTGRHSGDFVTLNSLEIGQSWNFFASNMSTHIAPPEGAAAIALARKFEQASQCATQVGLRDFTTYSQSGKRASKPNYPFKLYMVYGCSKPSGPEIDPMAGGLLSCGGAEMIG